MAPTAKAPLQSGSPINAVFSAAMFGALTALVKPPWSFIDHSSCGHLVLTAAHFWPLFVISLTARPSGVVRWMSCAVSGLAGFGLCLHAGLSSIIVADVDSGAFFSRGVALAFFEIFISTVSVPAGILLAQRRGSPGMAGYILIPVSLAASSQVLWFGLARAVNGASGIELWFASRIVIHLAFGLTAGFLWAGDRVFRPIPYPSHWGGLTELVISRLPQALPLSALVTLAVLVSGVLRISSELADRSRFVTARLDDYFLSLNNLNMAKQADLVYPELFSDLDRSRGALLGAVSFDRELASRTRAMLRYIEKEGDDSISVGVFRSSVMSVNRRLLDAGEPYFLEPHTLGQGPSFVKFLFRYRIERHGRYGLQGGGSVPILRLRRLDDILVDTPYTGLSYPGLGTLLMDHIEDVALRSHAILFLKSALDRDPEEGRFAATGMEVRRDRRQALEDFLIKRLEDPRTLDDLALFSERWRYAPDLFDIRSKMEPSTLAAFDALTEVLALQTEIHEARHAFDRDLPQALPELDELAAGTLASQAVCEIRACLTEIVDGPLGPRYALSSLMGLIMGKEARANAYFFASVLILEGLWGEKVRRPDFVEREGQDGQRVVVVPITAKHPGWLSYSRIHGAYSDLSALEPEELRERAIALFERLFDEEYQKIVRRR